MQSQLTRFLRSGPRLRGQVHEATPSATVESTLLAVQARSLRRSVESSLNASGVGLARKREEARDAEQEQACRLHCSCREYAVLEGGGFAKQRRFVRCLASLCPA